MTHKIAIIKVKEYFGDYDSDILIQSITDWAEVSDEEYKMLHKAQPRLGFLIIEQPLDQKKFIAQTISDYKILVAAEEIRLEEQKEERNRKIVERKMKKELKDKESKLELLQKLQKELGLDTPKV